MVDRAALRSITFNEYPEMVAKDRMSVLLAMMDQGVIPVFHHHDVDVGRKEIQACANGGAKCVEFTNRGKFAAHAFHEVTSHFANADPSVIMGVIHLIIPRLEPAQLDEGTL